MRLAFVLSVPRSGSTLLSTLLSKADGVYCPPEPWLLLGLDAVGKSHAENPANAASLNVAMAEFFDKERLPVLANAAREIYKSVLRRHDKEFFIDKTPRYYHCLPLVEELLVDAKAVVLLRNPLDVAASYRTTWAVNLPNILSEKINNPELFDYILGYRRLLEFSENHRALVVRYEDLVAKPAAEMERVFDYLGIRAPSSVADISRIDPRFAASALGDKKILETKSVHNQSVGSYRQFFEADEVKILLEGLGKDIFQRLGYGADFNSAVKEFSIEIEPSADRELRDAAEKFVRIRRGSLSSLPSGDKEGASLDSGATAFAPDPIAQAQAEIESLKQDLSDARFQQGALAKQLAAQGDQASVASQLRAELEAIENRGGRARVRDLLGYAKGRSKRLVHNALWRIASGKPMPYLPRISIVTPCYNCAEFIEETLLSVLNQPYPDLEYIVVDGGSTDGTREIVERYAARHDLPQRITRFISEPDEGMYDAISKGFAIATGEIFGYLNADDLFEGGGLTSVGTFFARHPRVDAIYHEDVVLVSGWKYPNIRQPSAVGAPELLSRHILFQDGVFWRRRAYQRAGGMDPTFRLAGDFDLWLRLSMTSNFVRRPEHVSCFRMRPGQLSNQMDGYNAEMQRAVDKFIAATSPARTVLWQVRGLVAKLMRRLARRLHRDRLFFPIDFVNVPPPPVIVPPRADEVPVSPIDGQPVDRLLFSTPDTRFGDREISYIYMDSRNGIAVTHPKLDAERLDGLYRKYYSAPPSDVKLADGPSPYRYFNGKSFLDRAFLKLPIDRLVRQRNPWEDRTLTELKRVLSSADVDVKAPLRFLDTGCFEGFLLDKIAGITPWQAYGLEPNQSAVAVARQKGHEVWQGHAEDAAEVVPRDVSFDVIFMGQTIEHVDDPVRVIRRLRLLLSPGGVLVMSTPNLDSREIDWFGPTWSHWHTPYHRHLFSKRGLVALAGQVGMQPVHVRSYSHPYWTAMSMTLNQQGLAGAVSHAVDFPLGTRRRALRANILKRVYYNRVGRGDYNYIVLRDGDK